MSPISLVVLLIAPITCHRLIVSPPENEWDSVVVQSDPIKITEGKARSGNDTRQPDYSIRLNKNTISEEEGEARSGRNCKYNDISCLYGTEAPVPEPEKIDNQEIVDRFLEQYSAITNAKFGTEVNRTEEVEEKSYWSSPRPTHPFDDKKNWVTLETVPWSTSMVSKWQPNVQPTHPSPSNYEPPTQQSHRPSEDKPWHYGGMSDKPVVPTIQTWATNRPAPVTTNYGSYTPVSTHFQHSKPSAQWGIGNNDIITDNRPTNFPMGNNGYQSFQGSTSNHYQTSPVPLYQEPQQTMTTHQAIRPTRYPSVTRHPSTYPDMGNGEWVLLSTTKGYSLPSGYRGSGKTMYEAGGNEVAANSKRGKNPEISRYHEEDIEYGRAPVSNRRNLDLGGYRSNEEKRENLKGLRVLHSENGSRIYAKDRGRHGRTDWNMEESPLQILYSSTNERENEPVATMRRTVRLQVLPPVGNATALAHDGLLEVDPSTHSVDEHKLLEEEKIKQLSKIAKVRRSNFTLYRVIPAPVGAVTGKSMRDKSAAVLAAVGAGMIPATMAMLVPMALGRKKRSLSDNELTFDKKKSPVDWLTKT